MQTDYIIELIQELTARVIALSRKIDMLTAMTQNNGGEADGGE